MMLRGAARMSPQIISPTLDDSMNDTKFIQAGQLEQCPFD